MNGFWTYLRSEHPRRDARRPIPRHGRKGTRRRAAPRVEPLEDRCVPSATLASEISPRAFADFPVLSVDHETYDPTRILVRFRDDPGSGKAIAGVGTVGPAHALVPGLHEVLLAPGTSVPDALAAYRADPTVLYAEPNYRVQALVIPDDPRFGELWGLHNTGQSGGTVDADIDAPEAWDAFAPPTGDPVVVAVIDTGIAYTHPDLVNRMWVNPGEIAGNGVDDDNNGFVDDVHGADFVNNDGDPFDDHDHGTHVAGTIAAEFDNAVGVAGVAGPANIQLMGLKFLSASGSGSTSGAIAAVNYAVAHGAKISNNSWGGGGFSQALFDAINNARTAGHLFVAAAGNDGTDNDAFPHYPSNYNLDNIISVAATNRNDQKAGFSNFGLTTVDLGAPGASILSTVPGGGYATFSGTSMASPHVAGAAALVWAQNPTWTYDQVRTKLFDTVDPIAALANRTVTGGRLNLAAALVPDTLHVAASTPAGGVSGPVSSVEVTFNRAINPASFTAADIASFTGPGGVDLTGEITGVSGSGATFTVAFTAQSALGDYAMVIGPDITDLDGNPMDQDRDGNPGETTEDQYTAAFTLTGPYIVSSTPDGGVNGSVSSVEVTFSEPMNAGSFTVADIASFTGPGGVDLKGEVTGVSGSGATFTVAFNTQSALGDYAMVIGPDITDLDGNPMDQDRDGNPGETTEDQYTAAFTLFDKVTFHSDDVPAPIEDFTITISELTISQDLTIGSLEVYVHVTHTWIGDVEVYLVRPGADPFSDPEALHPLVLQRGNDTDVLDVTFDDNAAAAIGSQVPMVGTFRPEEPLSAFNGISTLGTWELWVYDAYFLDQGTLHAWCMIVVPADPPDNDPPTAEAGGPYSGDEGSDITLDGSGSTDPDGSGDIVSYEWDLDDDGSYDDATGVNATFNRTADGTYTVGLRVTDSAGNADTDTATVTVNNVAPTAEAGGPYQITLGQTANLDASGSSDPGDDITAYDWDLDDDGSYETSGVTADFTPTAVGTYTVGLRVTDHRGATGTDTATVTVTQPSSGPNLATGVVTTDPLAGVDGWNAVTLAHTYQSLVVVATANYDNTEAPGVVRVRNAQGNRFEVQVLNPGGGAVGGIDVTYLAVEQGVYTQADDGITMEAHTVQSAVTDRKGSWVGQSVSYVNTYSSPVVFGQVLTANDPDWSVFWAHDGSRGAPSASSLYVGKHVGEDTDTTRAAETLGYVVFEAGTYPGGGVPFEVGVGPATVRGVTNGPPFTYDHTLSGANRAVVSQVGMSGGDGSWALLYGSDPVGSASLNVAVDEDQIANSERNHTTERLAYIVLVDVPSGPNDPPTAEAGGPYSGDEGSDITLDGSGSTDPDGSGDIVSYDWDLDDDGSYDDATGVTATFNRTADGTYTVGLRVTDSAGNADTDTATVTVNNVAPTAEAGGPYRTNLGQTVTLDGSGSSDPGNDITLYEWDLDNDGSYDDATGVTADFTPLAVQTYTVGLRVTDHRGATGTDTATVTVNVPPVADAGGPYSGDEGSDITLDGSGSTDPDGNITLYEWDLDDDGSYDDATGVNATFNRTADGTYTVGLRVTDNDGATATDTATVTVNNVAPTAEAGGPYQITLGSSANLDASGSSDPGNDITAYDWDLDDDGSYETPGVTASFTPTAVGSYTVGLRVTDHRGATGTDTATVIVTQPSSSGPELRVGTDMSLASWQTITLNHTYTDMVVVLTANYDAGNGPGVVRVRNAQGNSFQYQVVTPGGGAVAGVRVYYVVAEAGTYNAAEHGIKMEARSVTSTVTDHSGSFVGQEMAYGNSYNSPVVLGQVMSANDPEWSVFWSRGFRRWLAPSATDLYVGKHVGQDPNTVRADEKIGYLVFEAGTGTLGNIAYEAGLGADTVQGVGNNPPYTYSHSVASPYGAVVSQAAMDDATDGSWALLYGPNALSPTNLSVAVDEDQLADAERSHLTEQVAFFIFGSAPAPLGDAGDGLAAAAGDTAPAGPGKDGALAAGIDETAPAEPGAPGTVSGDARGADTPLVALNEGSVFVSLADPGPATPGRPNAALDVVFGGTVSGPLAPTLPTTDADLAFLFGGALRSGALPGLGSSPADEPSLLGTQRPADDGAPPAGRDAPAGALPAGVGDGSAPASPAASDGEAAAIRDRVFRDLLEEADVFPGLGG